eukprot:Skav213484  [mRNA]  locus=scaffold3849:32528:34909:- [translate_table: standard]
MGLRTRQPAWQCLGLRCIARPSSMADSMKLSVQYITGQVDQLEVTSDTRVSELKSLVKDAKTWEDQLEKDLTSVLLLTDAGQELDLEDHQTVQNITELIDLSKPLQVCFSIFQAECASSSDAEHLPSLQLLRLPQGLEDVAARAFAGCDLGAKKVVVPNGVRSIGAEAFQDCFHLQSVTLPDSLTNIGHGAFRGCCSLKRVVIPNSVKIIRAQSFYGCVALVEVQLPDSCESIGRFAFENCISLVPSSWFD